MPFSSDRKKTVEMFTNSQLFLNFIASQEALHAGLPVTTEVKIMKALFCVQLYASMEKSINDSVETLLNIVSSESIECKNLSHNLVPIALFNQFISIRDGKRSDVLSKATTIFGSSNSGDVAYLNPAVFSAELQNVWSKTINHILVSVGITEFSLSNVEKITVDEIVEKRNAIAHGRLSPVEVGERYTTEDLRKKLTILSGATTKLIDVFESYYIGKRHVKSSM